MKNGQFTPDTIIWSADVKKDEIAAVINAHALPEGTIIKLDRLFFETANKSFIHFCENAGYPVFCDAKIIEIPVKALGIAETYLSYKPYMLNIMAGACNNACWVADEEKNLDCLKRFADLCHQAGTRSCVVTVLTSKLPKLVDQEFGTDPLAQVIKYVRMAHHAGITDIVCSPAEVAEIRKFYGDEFYLNTPGVRLPDSSNDDQARVATPRAALEAGANRLVIGRDLTRGEGSIIERVERNYARILANINGETL